MCSGDKHALQMNMNLIFPTEQVWRHY